MRYMFQKPFLASNLEYVVEPANLSVISSKGIRMIALLRSFTFRHALGSISLAGVCE